MDVYEHPAALSPSIMLYLDSYCLGFATSSITIQQPQPDDDDLVALVFVGVGVAVLPVLGDGELGREAVFSFLSRSSSFFLVKKDIL